MKNKIFAFLPLLVLSSAALAGSDGPEVYMETPREFRFYKSECLSENQENYIKGYAARAGINYDQMAIALKALRDENGCDSAQVVPQNGGSKRNDCSPQGIKLGHCVDG